MLTLTTKIDYASMRKVDVQFYDKRDDDVPSCELKVRFWDTASKTLDGGTFTVQAFDSENSKRLQLNPSPSGAGDVIQTVYTSVASACTNLGAAYDGASGSRRARAEAAYTAAIGLGLIDSALVAT